MPVIKSAKKKLRQDKKRQIANKKIKEGLVALIKKAKKGKTLDAIKKAIQAADKAAKKGIIHKNKAARLKSQLSKLLPKEVPKEKSSPKKRKSS